MVLKVRLNSDDNKIYRLVSWDANSFQSSLYLTIQGNDLSAISNDFVSITKLEIYQDDILIATYSDFDTYDEISFIKNQYVQGEKIFVDAMKVHLTKTNIIATVQRLDEQINPVIDTSSMDLYQAKEYKIKELGELCRADIYAGDQVTFADGTTKTYTYNADDQANIMSAVTLAFAAKQMGFDLDYIPYHASGTMCELLDTLSMVTIYMTLQLKLTRLVTKCNMLNCMIKEMNNKEDVLNVSWSDELTGTYLEQYNTIVAASVAIANAMAEAMQPTDDPTDEPVSNEINEG